MKKKVLWILVIGSVLVTACTIGPGGICGPNIPAIYCASKEERDRALHPKAYGENWTKPGMTKESWRQDWVACGGMSNGQYAGYAPPGATTQMILESQERKRKKLDACMQEKDYAFRYSTP